MDFLGIGVPEVLFILIIALIIFGPNDMVKAGRSLGRFLRRLVTSPGYQTFRQTSREISNLPTKLMREAGLEEIKQEFRQVGPTPNPLEIDKELRAELHDIDQALSAWTSPATPSEPPSESSQNPQENS